jgi:DnaJ-class molecular chaperone
VFIIAKDHPELSRDGVDIHSDVEINYVDAILGTQVGAWSRRGRRGCSKLAR